MNRLGKIKKFKEKEVPTFSQLTPRDKKIIRDREGSCFICGSKNRLHLDHCHITDKVRGVLCNNCNLGLGLLGDAHENVGNAYAYLKYWDMLEREYGS